MRTTVFALTALLLLPAPVAADWLQYGRDAARTGAADGRAPEWDDVAFTVPLPNPEDADRSWATLRAAPLILDGSVYAIVPGGFNDETAACLVDPRPTGASVLYRIDLATGQHEPVVSFEWPLYHLASDGERIAAVGHGAVIAWNLDGTLAWGPRHLVDSAEPDPDAPAACRYIDETCGPPALHEAMLYAACADDGGRTGGGVHVGAWHFETGEPAWDEPFRAAGTLPSTASCDEPASDPASCMDAALVNPFAFQSSTSGYAFPPGVTVAGPWLVVTSGEVRRPAYGLASQGYGGVSAYAVERTTGDGRLLYDDFALQHTDSNSLGPMMMAFQPPAAAIPDGFFLKKDMQILRFDAIDPRLDHATSARLDGWRHGDLGSGFAISGEDVFVASIHRIHKLDLSLEPDLLFEPPTLPEGDAWDHGPLIVAGDLLLARSTTPTEGMHGQATTLHAIEAGTGQAVWRRGFDKPTSIAVADGILVAQSIDGRITVLGSTPAALQPRAEVTDRYPSPERELHVDLSATGSGIHGPATEYRADWGDGTTTLWSSEPEFTHRYAESRDMHARFFVRNDVGQTASIPVTFHVGQKDPALNIMNSPFSDEYQETSFFLLGLILTFVAAALGVYRAGRKRRRLERELRDLEAEHQARRDDPARCDTMLAARKTRARALFLRKKLEDAHASFLERRIDELRQGVRISAAEESLKFLPFGMVQHLRRLLQDGRIDAWERSHFLEALDRASELSDAQRRQVHGLIESWFASDSGGAA